MTKALVIAACVLALPLAARADDSKAEAKQHIDRATQLHKDGKLAQSLDELKTAYALDPQAQLLFAMGQIHVQLGECSQAIVYYERFLATKPADDAATVTREAIETCKTNPPPAIQTRPAPVEPVVPAAPATAAPAPASPVAAAPTAVTAPWYRDYVGDGLVAGGVVTGVVGIVLYSGALSARADADHATSYQAFSNLVDHAHTERTTAVVFGIGAAALVTAGAVHLVLHHRAPEVTVAAGGATTASVVWSGRF